MSIQSIWEFLSDPNTCPSEGKTRRQREPVYRPRYQVIVTTPEGDTQVYKSIREAAVSHGVSHNVLRKMLRESGMTLVRCRGITFEYRMENQLTLPFFHLGPPEDSSTSM